MSATRTCGPCTRASDNTAWDCPPRMADGRLFTDYRPRCDINMQYQPRPAVGSYEYRQFLIRNADNVIGEHRDAAFTKAYSGPCVQPFETATMLPEADAFVCDKVSCRCESRNPTGLGTGRDYGMLPESKRALDAFLAEQASAQKRLQDGANCCACGGDGGYYPLPGLNVGAPLRPAVPGGGLPMSGGDASVKMAM